MQPQPLIAVRDVEASSRWYQRQLGCKSGHGGTEYEQLVDEGGRLILQLHAWDEEDHPNLVNRREARPGHGVLVWFEVDDFDAAVARAHALSTEILEGPMVNPNANHREIWLRDPDGYVVVLASAYGDV